MRPELSPAQVAARYPGLTELHIRKLAREGKIPHFRIGALIKFDPDEVEQWLRDAHRVPAGTAA